MLAMNYVEVNDPRGGEHYLLCLTGHWTDWLDFERWDAESQLDEFCFKDLGESGLPS